MTDNFHFLSSDYAPEKAFEEYASLYSHGADVFRGEGHFHAHVRAWRLDGILLFERFLSGVIHSRVERVLTDNFDHVVVTLVIAGRLKGSPESGFQEVRPGDIVLADTQKAALNEATDAHLITASVDRQLIEAGLGTTTGLHGRVLKQPGNLILADFMQSLVRNSNQLTLGSLPALARAFVDILASIDDFSTRASSETRRQEFIRREVVERYIATHIGDRALAVDSISVSTGLSRSALYRLFEDQGGIAKLIQRRRLDAIRSALDSIAIGRSNDESIDEIARRFGLLTGAQANRMFTEMFGVSGEVYLENLQSLGAGTAEANRRRWAGWMTEIS